MISAVLSNKPEVFSLPETTVLIQHHPLDKGINPGDLVILAGARKAGLKGGVILCGTPWLGDGCTRTDRFTWLRGVLDLNPDLTAVGIGSVGHVRPEEFVALREVWGRIKSISVRDPHTKAIFDAIGVETKLDACPSIHALDCVALPSPVPGSTLVIEAISWHGELWPAAPWIPGATVVNYTSGQWTEESAVQQLKYFALFECIISQRVHAAIPFVRKREVYISPVDSRHETAVYAGVPVWKG
jgi:hypothetical protein